MEEEEYLLSSLTDDELSYTRDCSSSKHVKTLEKGCRNHSQGWVSAVNEEEETMLEEPLRKYIREEVPPVSPVKSYRRIEKDKNKFLRYRPPIQDIRLSEGSREEK